jgi:putative heme-binding domain-containing protein
VTLIGGFEMPTLEHDLLEIVTKPQASDDSVMMALQALQEMRSSQIAYLPALVKNGSKEVSLQATATLVASRAPEAAVQALELYPTLSLAHRRVILISLSSTKVGAKALAEAVLKHRVAASDIDGPTAEKMTHTLGDGPELKALMSELGQVFRPVLSLHGKNSIAETNINLVGPFTLEFWVRLAPDINNNDGVLGAPNQLDVNFAGARLRLYAFPPLGDVIVAKNPITPEVWTHYAITRNAQGELRLYCNGELESVSQKSVTRDFKGCQVGWTVPKKGTFGALAEYRVWNVVRTASEIRNNFTRSYAGESRPAEMTFYNAGGDSSWGKLLAGASVVQTTDVPPLLSAEQFKVFEQKNEHYMALGRQGGDVTKGRAVAAICMVCHMINGQGGQIGPNLSGAGAMGLEGVVRNIMDPNAAMEAAYRTFRLELKSGDLIDAFYVTEDAQAYVIRQPASADRRVLKSEVQSARYIRRSLMPEGLLEGLTDEQVRDLLAYLMTLK